MQLGRCKCVFLDLAVLLTIFLAAPAMADRPSYNFVHAGYQTVNLDLGGGADFDGDGFALGGSFEIGENMFGFANYTDTGFDFSVDQTQIFAGLGWRSGLSDNTDFYAFAGYLEFDVDAPGLGSFDESGFGVGIGVRSNVTDLIELTGEISYADLGSNSENTTVSGGIWFNITDSFALGLGAATDDDVTSFGGSVRLYFGR